jgi:hypothetical protein
MPHAGAELLCGPPRGKFVLLIYRYAVNFVTSPGSPQRKRLEKEKNEKKE